MAEEQDPQPEEKLKLELPGLFGGRKRKKKGGTSAEDDAPAEPVQPFEDHADEDVDEEYDDVEEPAAPAPASRFAPPGSPVEEDTAPAADVEQTRQLPEVASTGSTRVERSAKQDVVSTSSTTERKPRTPPSPLVVSIIVGLFVGVLACGLTYAGMVGCQKIQGTTACGGPGFFVLMAIIVMLVAAGSFLLKQFGVREPTSTSLLAVGLVAVVALAFLIEVIFAWWMIIVIPLLSAVAYAGSNMLTHTFATVDLED